MQGVKKTPSMKKEAMPKPSPNQKNKQDRQFIEAGFTNLTVKGESVTFLFGSHRMRILTS
jgi:hypothetical protein